MYLNSYSSLINKHISVVLTSRALKLKSACPSDGNAIISVLYNKLYLFIRTSLGPEHILEYFVLYFKFYLVTSTLLRE